MAAKRQAIRSPRSSVRELVRRVPDVGELRLGRETVFEVEEGQAAVVVRGGRPTDVLGPGRHRMGPHAAPKFFAAPATQKHGQRAGSVYFVADRVVAGRSWSTRSGIRVPDRNGTMRDWSARGQYGFRIVDPVRFIAEFSTGNGSLTSRRAAGRISTRVTEAVAAAVRATVIQDDEVSLRFNDIATEARLRLRSEFRRIGLELTDFYLTSLTPTDGRSAAVPRAARARYPAVTRPAGGAGGGGLLRRSAAAPSEPGGASRGSGTCGSCGGPVPRGATSCLRCGARRTEAGDVD